MPVYYPIFLDLAQRRCLVVGGGIVAERKVCGLLEVEAAVVVVSPSVTTALRRRASQGVITHISRAFRDVDVEGCALIIAATDREEVNRQVALAARRRRIWVNTVDTPAACDFIAPAVVRRGAVQIAISTGGKSPTLAKRLREGLEAFIGPEYGDVADILGALRAAIRGGGETPEGRKVIFERLVEASGLPLLMAAPPKDPAAVPVRIPGDVRPKAKARVLKVLTVSVKRLMQRRV